MLYVDCENRSQELLEPRGQIDVSGNISISKLGDSRETVPVSYLCKKKTIKAYSNSIHRFYKYYFY